MLINTQKARFAKVAIFTAATPEGLEDALQEWFDSQDETDLLGVEFKMEADVEYAAFVLYTE